MSITTGIVKALFDGKKPEAPSRDVKLRAVFLSDTHITRAGYRRAILKGTVKKLSRFSPDVVVFAGDCTDNGNDKNWASFKDIIDGYCKIKRRIIAIGNHDTWLSYDEDHAFAPAKENYLKYSNGLMGTSHGEVYFKHEEKGYTFLVMGTEGTSVAADVSEEQLSWLSGELKKTDKNKPVFVINHHPMNFTHGVGDNFNSMGMNGSASDALKDIFSEYGNIVYFCGHLHFGLTKGFKKDFDFGTLEFSTIEKIGKNTSVCLPSAEYGSIFSMGIGYPLPGAALIMDVSDKKITLRGCNALLGREIKSFDYEIAL